MNVPKGNRSRYVLWLRCLTIWKDEFIWQIKMGYKAFRKFEMNWFLCLYFNLVRKLDINAFFILIYIPVANFGTHPLLDEITMALDSERNPSIHGSMVDKKFPTDVEIDLNNNLVNETYIKHGVDENLEG